MYLAEPFGTDKSVCGGIEVLSINWSACGDQMVKGRTE